MIDLHLHSSFSHDSDELPENYIKRALEIGASRLGFSEHYDYDGYLANPEKTYCLANLDGFFKSCANLSAKFPQVKILKGVELGFCAEAVPHYKSLLASRAFDYAILSVHTVNGRGDCYYPEFFKGLTKRQAYENYFNAVLESVRSDLNFQIVGHIGYVTRYAPYPEKRAVYSEFSCVLDKILKTVVDRGVCLEINSSASGTGLPFLPDKEIILRYVALGGKNFTFGSDAHSAERFMQNADAAKEFLSGLGIKEICSFENYKMIREEL